MTPSLRHAGQADAGNDVDDRTPFGARTASGAARLAWTACGLHANLRLPGKALWKRLGRRYPGPFDRKVDGIRLRIYPTENFGDRTIACHNRLPECDELAIIDPYLRPGGRFVDIGANIGVYSIHASKRVGSGGRVLAFEPHPETARKLAFNLAANGSGNVERFDCALGSHDGQSKFYPDGDKNAGRSSVLRDAVGEPARYITVSIRKLADVINERDFGCADLLKIDVEGFEDRVLAPFFRDTPGALWPRAVLLEDVHRDLWEDDIVERMRSIGYFQSARTESNLLLALEEQAVRRRFA